MKKIFYTGFFILLAIGFNSCKKDFGTINTNKNKIYDVEIDNLFSGTVSRSMKLIAELNYNRLLNFSRYSIVQTTNPSQDDGDNYFKQFYVGIIRDLDQLEIKYTGKAGFENRLAIVKTWKSYMYYMMVSIYGSVPMSDAITDVANKRDYKYDSEKEIYTQLLQDLADAGSLYNLAAPNDCLVNDPVFGGLSYGKSDLSKWQKFSNTLRLNIALQAQNISEDLAREHALAAMQDESKLISSVNDIVKLQWGRDVDLSSSYYYTRFQKSVTSFNSGDRPALGEYFAIYLFSYKDPRIDAFALKSGALAPAGQTTIPYSYTDTLTRKHERFCGNDQSKPEYYCSDYAKHQLDGLNSTRYDSVLVNYSMPYVPLAETNDLAAGWQYATVPGTTTGEKYHEVLNKPSQYSPSFVTPDFIKEDASMVLLNWADACFLKAEAAERFGIGGSAQAYYEAGIRASFAQYGMADKADAYMAQNGVKWNTNGRGYADRRLLYRANINGQGGTANHLEQIYKQRYMADFFNGLEGWNLERRTRVLRFPPFFANGASSNAIGQNNVYNYWSERFIYPIAELTKNPDEYYKGIQNLKAASPFYRSDRWGDNVFTSLGFSKLNPDLATANALYGGAKLIVTNAEYFNKKYGTTYETVVLTAKQMTGETDESTALTKAFNYRFQKRLNSFIP